MPARKGAPGRNLALALDVKIALETISGYVRGKTFVDFVGNQMMQDAVLRQLGVAGEAASQMDQTFRAAHASPHWRGIIAMRHHLIHRYDSVDQTIVWQTVSADVPALLAFIKSEVPELGQRTKGK